MPYRLDFDSPWYLLLLAMLPVMWWFGRRSLSGLGRVRKWVVLLLRSAVFVLIVLSLAEIQWVRTNDNLTVIYLLDQSLSIPPERRQAMIEFVNEAVRQHRKGLDRVGVIVFGREAVIEIPPFDESVQLAPQVESPLDPESTNLAGALKLAQATFPEDAAKRIVIVSDGNQNMGDALDQARHVADAGVSIDVQPVLFTARSEVMVEKVTLPPDVRKGQPFDLRVVLNNTTQPPEGESGVVKGKLIVSQRTDDQPRVIAEENVELPPGKRVWTVRQQLDQPHFYTYEARFVPDNPADDGMVENNRATTFTHVRGSGQVLLIEDVANRGEHEFLVEHLRHENLEVTIHASDQLFNGLAELQQFDTVVLANVPREEFTDQQILMLSENTQSMGCGLVMLGGPNSFGAGGWNNTPIEEAMPVDFQIKSAKVVPKGALALVMHASEMADGNHWQKVIAK
ncbi:MAG: VWA domain-containing protein, partial [Pirellulales bacterium]